MIAGHQFPLTPPRVCSCGRSWDVLVQQRHRWCVGALELAHVGALNEQEVTEMQNELVRIYDLAMGRVGV